MKVKRVLSFAMSLATCLSVFTAASVSTSALSYSGSASYKNSVYYTRLTNVSLTNNQRADVVNVALSQVGYRESNSSSDLSGTAFGGISDCTEYGRWYGLQDLWCAMFASWCEAVANVPTSIVPSNCSTVEMLGWFINEKIAYTREQVANGIYTPQAGDLIFYKYKRNSAMTNHVGIVTSYSNNVVNSVEGNTGSSTDPSNGGEVGLRSHNISDTEIVYICSPEYTDTSASSKYLLVATTVGQGFTHLGGNSTRAQVAAGDTAYVEAIPSANYRVSSVVVGGTAFAIQSNGGRATYSFTMPRGNVEVIVTYEPNPTTQNYVLVATSEGPGFTHFGGNSTYTMVPQGFAVNFEVAPNPYCRVAKIIVGGTEYKVQNNGGSYVYSFAMPNGNVQVKVIYAANYNTSFGAASGNYLNTVDQVGGNRVGVSQYGVITASASQGYSTNASTGFSISGWSVHSQKISFFRYLIDGSVKGELGSSSREDVYNATRSSFAASGLANINAYSGNICTANLSRGNHTVVVQAVTFSGKCQNVAQIALTIR